MPENINVTPSNGGNGALYFIVGMLVVAMAVGAFFLFGQPGGSGGTVAKAPDQNINVTIDKRTPAPAPAAPAPTK